jgi:predicted kinase
MPNMVVVVFGLPGTGKTYFSRQLKDEIYACHLNTDKIRVELDKKGKYDEKSRQEVYGRLMDNTREKLRLNNNVIVDGTFHKQARRAEFAKTASETGHDIFFIEVKASEETVRKRLAEKRKYSEADFNVYRKIKEEFEPFPEDHLVIWPDQENFARVLVMAKNYIYGYSTGACPD